MAEPQVEWQRGVTRAPISGPARRVAWAMSLYGDFPLAKTVFPSAETLVVDTGLELRDVRRARAELRLAGWITPVKIEGDRRPHYRLSTPAVIARPAVRATSSRVKEGRITHGANSPRGESPTGASLPVQGGVNPHSGVGESPLRSPISDLPVISQISQTSLPGVTVAAAPVVIEKVKKTRKPSKPKTEHGPVAVALRDAWDAEWKRRNPDKPYNWTLGGQADIQASLRLAKAVGAAAIPHMRTFHDHFLSGSGRGFARFVKVYDTISTPATSENRNGGVSGKPGTTFDASGVSVRRKQLERLPEAMVHEAVRMVEQIDPTCSISVPDVYTMVVKDPTGEHTIDTFNRAMEFCRFVERVHSGMFRGPPTWARHEEIKRHGMKVA